MSLLLICPFSTTNVCNYMSPCLTVKSIQSETRLFPIYPSALAQLHMSIYITNFATGNASELHDGEEARLRDRPPAPLTPPLAMPCIHRKNILCLELKLFSSVGPTIAKEL